MYMMWILLIIWSLGVFSQTAYCFLLYNGALRGHDQLKCNLLNEVRKEEIGPSFGYIFHKPSSLLHEIVDKGDKIEVAKF